MSLKKTLLVFIHIERAAGTTLDYILRRNFFLSHIEVRPLSKDSNGVFKPSDLKKTLRVNPALQSISGHSICPALSRLETIIPNVKYITVLREPIKRYISHYQYRVEKLNERISFEEYLDQEKFSNLQTKKIAGCIDLAKAKKILKNRFFLTGIVEEFDEFLMLLKKKLIPMHFNTSYSRVNVGNRSSLRKRLEKDFKSKHQSEIIRQNQVDIELYKFVKQKLLPTQRAEIGRNLNEEVEVLSSNHKPSGMAIVKSYADFAVRKLYYNPILGTMRLLNGLPYKGSY